MAIRNGKPASEFMGTAKSGATVYIMYETNPAAWKPDQVVTIQVTKKTPDGETYAETKYFKPSYKPKTPMEKLFFYSGYAIGEYIIRVVDKDDEKKIYYTGGFTVKMAPDPNNATGTVWACDHVDDNWAAVGAVTRIKAGKCVNLLLKMPKQIDEVAFIGWIVYKVKADGTDGDYVDALQQTIQGVKLRYFATSDPVCMFAEKGKYRIYANDWYSSNSGTTHTGNLTQYYGKMELVVE